MNTGSAVFILLTLLQPYVLIRTCIYITNFTSTLCPYTYSCIVTLKPNLFFLTNTPSNVYCVYKWVICNNQGRHRQLKSSTAKLCLRTNSRGVRGHASSYTHFHAFPSHSFTHFLRNILTFYCMIVLFLL